MAVSKKVREIILARDNYTCQACGRSRETHNARLHVDHKISTATGGLDNIENLITLCMECNISKSWQSLEGYMYGIQNANIIQKTRMSKFMTRRELAYRSGLTIPTIVRIEYSTSVHIDTIKKVSVALGLDYEQVYNSVDWK